MYYVCLIYKPVRQHTAKMPHDTNLQIVILQEHYRIKNVKTHQTFVNIIALFSRMRCTVLEANSMHISNNFPRKADPQSHHIAAWHFFKSGLALHLVHMCSVYVFETPEEWPFWWSPLPPYYFFVAVLTLLKCVHRFPGGPQSCFFFGLDSSRLRCASG